MIRLMNCLAFALILAAPSPAASAARFCADRVESGAPSASSQADAQAAAQSWWASRAGALGRGYQDWNVAADKKIDCQEMANGSFRCVASAKPCLPDGVLPENVPKLEM